MFHTGFRSRTEPGYLARARAVTLARLRLHLKYLFNNSRKLYGTLTSFDVSSKVNYDLYVLVHVLERILDNL